MSTLDISHILDIGMYVCKSTSIDFLNFHNALCPVQKAIT
jgi:hypothetical protein